MSLLWLCRWCLFFRISDSNHQPSKLILNGKTIPRKIRIYILSCALNSTDCNKRFVFFFQFSFQSIWHSKMFTLHGIDKFHRVGYASSTSSIPRQMLFVCRMQCTVNQRWSIWYARIVRVLSFALRHRIGITNDRIDAAINELPIFAIQFVTKWSN